MSTHFVNLDPCRVLRQFGPCCPGDEPAVGAARTVGGTADRQPFAESARHGRGDAARGHGRITPGACRSLLTRRDFERHAVTADAWRSVEAGLHVAELRRLRDDRRVVPPARDRRGRHRVRLPERHVGLIAFECPHARDVAYVVARRATADDDLPAGVGRGRVIDADLHVPRPDRARTAHRRATAQHTHALADRDQQLTRGSVETGDGVTHLPDRRCICSDEQHVAGAGHGRTRRQERLQDRQQLFRHAVMQRDLFEGLCLHVRRDDQHCVQAAGKNCERNARRSQCASHASARSMVVTSRSMPAGSWSWRQTKRWSRPSL